MYLPLMYLQVAINTPVRARSAVRGPHLDGPGELWAGLLYLRHEADQASTGGELQARGLGQSSSRRWHRSRRWIDAFEVLCLACLVLAGLVGWHRPGKDCVW